MTQRLYLRKLLAQGESQTLEFKKSLSLKREALEALCAMVNAGNALGVVIFGIEPDGSVCGIEPGNLDTAQRSLSQAINAKFDPPITFQIEVRELNDRKVLVLRAERSGDVPYHEYDGRAWIRQGTENKRLTLAEKQQLMRRRNRDHHPGPWRCNRCGKLVGKLFSFEVTNEGMVKTYRCKCGGEFWPVK